MQQQAPSFFSLLCFVKIKIPPKEYIGLSGLNEATIVEETMAESRIENKCDVRLSLSRKKE